MADEMKTKHRRLLGYIILIAIGAFYYLTTIQLEGEKGQLIAINGILGWVFFGTMVAIITSELLNFARIRVK